MISLELRAYVPTGTWFQLLQCGEYRDEGFIDVPGAFPGINATVVNETGLAGNYDIYVIYRSPSLGTNGNLDGRPLLMDALAEELGLTLERGTWKSMS
jgi:hypothetical protein